MLEFCIAILLLLISPGPGVLSAAGVGAAFGFRPGLRYLFGLFLGTNLVAIAVVTGLATILLANDLARNILLVASTIYLLYLATRIAFAGSRIAFISASSKPGIIAGTLFQTINPKSYAVNTTLFSGFAFLPGSLLTETLVKFLIMNLIWIPVHLLWLAAGNATQQMDMRPRTHILINRFMALAMLGVVVLAWVSLI